jgi:hypothetical protein
LFGDSIHKNKVAILANYLLFFHLTGNGLHPNKQKPFIGSAKDSKKVGLSFCFWILTISSPDELPWQESDSLIGAMLDKTATTNASLSPVSPQVSISCCPYAVQSAPGGEKIWAVQGRSLE